VPVISVTESQVPDLAGQLTDVYEIVFTIEGRDGSFTITVDKHQDPVAAARAAIDAERGEVEAIYGL
jgi:hypothetical protein